MRDEGNESANRRIKAASGPSHVVRKADVIWLRLIGQSIPQALPEISAGTGFGLVHVLGDVRLFHGGSERSFRHQLYRRSA